MKLPSDLEEWLNEQAANLSSSPRDKFDIAKIICEALFAKLCESGSEFDEKAFKAEWHFEHGSLMGRNVEQGARWQHEQSRAREAALLTGVKIWEDEAMAYANDNEKLRFRIKELEDCHPRNMQERIFELETTVTINASAAKNASDKLVRANERIVEFEEIKSGHLEVQKKLHERIAVLTEALKTVRYGLIGHRGNGELLPEIDQAFGKDIE